MPWNWSHAEKYLTGQPILHKGEIIKTLLQIPVSPNGPLQKKEFFIRYVNLIEKIFAFEFAWCNFRHVRPDMVQKVQETGIVRLAIRFLSGQREEGQTRRGMGCFGSRGIPCLTL